MGTGTAPRVAGNGNHLAGHDGSPPTNQHLGKVAIADGVTAVTEGDEVTRTPVVPHLDHHARQHGVSFFTFGTQVDPVVPTALLAERVDTETIRRSDSNTLQRIGDAHVSPYPLAILIGREFPCRRNRLLIWIGNLFYRGKAFFVSVRQTGCRLATVWNCALADRHTDSMDNIRIAFIRTKVGRELRLLYI